MGELFLLSGSHSSQCQEEAGQLSGSHGHGKSQFFHKLTDRRSAEQLTWPVSSNPHNSPMRKHCYCSLFQKWELGYREVK